MNEDEKAELEALRAENAKLKNQKKAGSGGVSFKVSEKGGVSVYGLGRFPVTLYKEQWERLFTAYDELKSFIKENQASLKIKE